VKGRERYVHVDLVKKGEDASARWLTVVAGRHKGDLLFLRVVSKVSEGRLLGVVQKYQRTNIADYQL
jgi:hypothetical protein